MSNEISTPDDDELNLPEDAFENEDDAEDDAFENEDDVIEGEWTVSRVDPGDDDTEDLTAAATAATAAAAAEKEAEEEKQAAEKAKAAAGTEEEDGGHYDKPPKEFKEATPEEAEQVRNLVKGNKKIAKAFNEIYGIKELTAIGEINENKARIFKANDIVRMYVKGGGFIELGEYMKDQFKVDQYIGIRKMSGQRLDQKKADAVAKVARHWAGWPAAKVKGTRKVKERIWLGAMRSNLEEVKTRIENGQKGEDAQFFFILGFDPLDNPRGKIIGRFEQDVRKQFDKELKKQPQAVQDAFWESRRLTARRILGYEDEAPAQDKAAENKTEAEPPSQNKDSATPTPGATAQTKTPAGTAAPNHNQTQQPPGAGAHNAAATPGGDVHHHYNINAPFSGQFAPGSRFEGDVSIRNKDFNANSVRVTQREEPAAGRAQGQSSKDKLLPAPTDQS